MRVEEPAAAQEVTARRDALSHVFRDNGVELACLFGSVLEDRPARDVDIAVLFERYDFDRYQRVLEATQRVLAAQHVDVVPLNHAAAPLRLRALLEGVPIFARSATSFVEAAVEALFAYEDHRRFAREYLRFMDLRIREGLSVANRAMDASRVETYLSSIDDAVAQIRRLAVRFASIDQFLADVDTRELCVHYLRIALESVLDVCRHFLAVAGVRLAEVETANLIALAGDRGLLVPEFAARIRGMAGMRNAIVHAYTRLDYQAIYRAVTEQLVDFDEFARQVRLFLAK
jgi:uncharacterized protein YutE (UPF0331/DUF86 family)/predicted nucleotidyltransferase